MSHPEVTSTPRKLMRPGLKQWLALLALVVLWGSRYYAVEIALVAYTPLDIVFLQLFLAAFVLWCAMLMRGTRLPRDLRSWIYFSLLAFIGNVAPFYLESWGQVDIDSSLVGILMSVSPLSVLLLAHLLLPDERATGLRLTGFLFGLIGVTILIGPDALSALGGNPTTIVAQLAILLAAVCYGLAAVVTRLSPSHTPLTMSAGVMVAAAAQLLPFWWWRGQADIVAAPWDATLAVAGIGLACTALAALVFFYLIRISGATFQSLVNYLLPVWAVMIGTSLLDEPIPENGLIALALVFVSLWMTQRSASDVSVQRSD